MAVLVLVAGGEEKIKTLSDPLISSLLLECAGYQLTGVI